jgi:outer membrane protein assembly factor BamD (BamD/ComL family)
MNQFVEAANELEVLISWIAPSDNPYASTAAEKQSLVGLLEKATFQRGQCFARVSEPANQIPEYRDKAIRAFDIFVKMFDNSELAPKALGSKGTVLLELKRFDEATKTFDELAAKYPNSAEGKNALYSLARAAMEIKQYDQGVSAFQRMMDQAQVYDADEFVRLGQMMGDAGYSKEAIKAFAEAQNKVSQMPAEKQETMRPVLERSLFGIAQAYFSAKQYNEAIQAVDELLTKYPKTGLFYDAKFLQGQAYRDAGQLANAVTALSDVFRYASDSALINRATLTLAEVQAQNGDLIDALASYQRIALLTDRNNLEYRPAIEAALMKSIELGTQLSRYKEVIENCDEYIKLFPQGSNIEQVRKMRGDAVLQSAAP